VFNGFDDADANTGWALELVFKADLSVRWNIHVAKLGRQGQPRNAGLLQ